MALKTIRYADYQIKRAEEEHSTKIVFAIPTTGSIRFEWHAAFGQMVIPTNWAHAASVVVVSSPIGYRVAEARNEIVRGALEKNYEWIFFIDHDVLLPPNVCLVLRDHMLRKDTPILCGLYYTKSSVPEPLVFRGRGTGPYYNWKPGEKVWVDAVPMGMTMVHMSLFRNMKPPWFNTPREVKIDTAGNFVKTVGTEDIWFCDRVIEEGVLKKAGWDQAAKKKYPFLCDTSLFGPHIDLQTGLQYPSAAGNTWQENHSAYYKAHKDSERRARQRKRRKRRGD